MPSAAKAAEQFILRKPYLLHGLSNDLLNYSKVARYIAREIGIPHQGAILAATRRLRDKLNVKATHDIIRLLKGSSMVVRTDMTALILSPDAPILQLIDLQRAAHNKGDSLHVISSESAVTVIIPSSRVSLVGASLKKSILKTHTDLVELCLKSGARLESVPGVMGYLYSLLGENGINIKETLSCWTDTILILEKKDLSKALSILDFSHA